MNPTGHTTFEKILYYMFTTLKNSHQAHNVFAEVHSMSQQCLVPGGKRFKFRSRINVVLGSGDVAT